MKKPYYVNCCNGMFDWDNCYFDTIEQVKQAIQDNFSIYELPYTVFERKGEKFVEIAKLEWTY